VREILDFYLNNGAAMFDKAGIIRRLQYQYKSEPLAQRLQQVFGATTTFGASEVETLLLHVMQMQPPTRHGQCRTTHLRNTTIQSTAHAICTSRFGSWRAPALCPRPISRWR
jgi:hypothetical protein